MRLNELILEDAYTPIKYKSTDDFVKFKKAILPKILPYADSIRASFNHTPIFRGMKNTGSLILGDGNQLERKSANTTNYYTFLIDNMISGWDAFPKRSKSFICTTNYNKAKQYSDGSSGLYYVIPLEDQPIGVCPMEDFWFSFRGGLDAYGIRDLDDFNYVFANLFLRINIAMTGKHVELSDTLEGFKADIQLMEKFLIEHDNEQLEEFAKGRKFSDMLLSFAADGGVLRSLNHAFNPKANGFKLDNAGSIPGGDHEVWMSGKVLFIKSTIYKLMEDVLDETT